MEKQIREIIAQNVGGTYEAKQKCAEEILRLMDLRVENIFNKEMKGDTSFQEKPSGLELLFNRHNYKHQIKLRKTWHKGIKYGIEIGLRKASLEGQKIELNYNTKESKHKEYLEKFYKLSEEYGCAVQYHPEIGMVVVACKNGL